MGQKKCTLFFFRELGYQEKKENGALTLTPLSISLSAHSLPLQVERNILSIFLLYFIIAIILRSTEWIAIIYLSLYLKERKAIRVV